VRWFAMLGIQADDAARCLVAAESAEVPGEHD